MRRLENINCPNCGQKMEAGYIFSPREISWTDNEKNIVIVILEEKETLVPIPIFKSKKVPAYKCKNCMIATFEYDCKY